MSTPQERLDANPELKARLSDSLAHPERAHARTGREFVPEPRGQIDPETKERLRKAFRPSRSPLWRLRKRIVRMLRPPVRTRPPVPTFEPEEIAAGHFPADKAEAISRSFAEIANNMTGNTREMDYREFLDGARKALAVKALNPLPLATRAVAESMGLSPDDERVSHLTNELIARGVIPSKQILENVEFAISAIDVLDGTLYDEEDDLSSIADELQEWKDRFR